MTAFSRANRRHMGPRTTGIGASFLVAAYSGEGLLNERRTAPQPWRRELAFMPRTGHCAELLWGASGGKRVAIRSKGGCYSMTSSARARIDGGTVRPSALAVFKLSTSSNVVGCWTGRSAGLAPLRIFPVYSPTMRLGKFGLTP